MAWKGGEQRKEMQKRKIIEIRRKIIIWPNFFTTYDAMQMIRRTS